MRAGEITREFYVVLRGYLAKVFKGQPAYGTTVPEAGEVILPSIDRLRRVVPGAPRSWEGELREERGRRHRGPMLVCIGTQRGNIKSGNGPNNALPFQGLWGPRG